MSNGNRRADLLRATYKLLSIHGRHHVSASDYKSIEFDGGFDMTATLTRSRWCKPSSPSNGEFRNDFWAVIHQNFITFGKVFA